MLQSILLLTVFVTRCCRSNWSGVHILLHSWGHEGGSDDWPVPVSSHVCGSILGHHLFLDWCWQSLASSRKCSSPGPHSILWDLIWPNCAPHCLESGVWWMLYILLVVCSEPGAGSYFSLFNFLSLIHSRFSGFSVYLISEVPRLPCGSRCQFW